MLEQFEALIESNRNWKSFWDYWPSDVQEWVKDLLRGRPVRPLCLVGREIGFSTLVKVLEQFVKTHYNEIETMWTYNLFDSRLVVMDHFPSKLGKAGLRNLKAIVSDKWLRCERQMVRPYFIPNRVALLCHFDLYDLIEQQDNLEIIKVTMPKVEKTFGFGLSFD